MKEDRPFSWRRILFHTTAAMLAGVLALVFRLRTPVGAGVAAMLGYLITSFLAWCLRQGPGYDAEADSLRSR